MEVLRLGVELKLQLLAYATATPDLSHICGLRGNLRKCQIPNTLSEARDQTCNPHGDYVRLLTYRTTMGTP